MAGGVGGTFNGDGLVGIEPAQEQLPASLRVGFDAETGAVGRDRDTTGGF